MRRRPIVWELIAFALVIMSCGIDQAFGQDSDLVIANRFFSQRKNHQKKQTLLGFVTERESGSRLLTVLRPNGFSVGERWRVQLSLIRPPSDSQAHDSPADQVIEFRVIQWTGFPQGQLILRLSSVGGAVSAFYLEQRIRFREALSDIRRCHQRGGCGPWAAVSSQTLRLAGEDQGLGWEHGPVVFPVDSLVGARVDAQGASWSSEDFFGRSISWSWSAGDPWPRKIQTPQGTAILDMGGNER